MHAEIEKERKGYLANKYFVIDVFPAPDGAVMMINFFSTKKMIN